MLEMAGTLAVCWSSMKPHALALLFTAAIGCSGVGDVADKKTILPVNDPTAKDSTPQREDKVAKLSIMDSLPQGGLCSVQNYRRGADALREIRYETSSPKRTYIIEIGRPPRVFPPLSIEVSGTQDSPGLRETENVYIAF